MTASRNIDNFGTDHGRSYRWPVGGCENGNNKNLRNLWISKGIKKSSTTKERLYKKFEKKKQQKGKKKNIYHTEINLITQAGTVLNSTWNTINELQSDLY